MALSSVLCPPISALTPLYTVKLTKSELSAFHWGVLPGTPYPFDRLTAEGPFDRLTAEGLLRA